MPNFFQKARSKMPGEIEWVNELLIDLDTKIDSLKGDDSDVSKKKEARLQNIVNTINEEYKYYKPDASMGDYSGKANLLRVIQRELNPDNKKNECLYDHRGFDFKEFFTSILNKVFGTEKESGLTDTAKLTEKYHEKAFDPELNKNDPEQEHFIGGFGNK